MPPTMTEIFRVFGRIGLLSFGGPAAQIALMHKELVEDRPWLSDTQFLNALSFCMLLPGPEAMQLCTYCGWRLKGVPGGVLAGALFVLPGAVVILALATIYALLGDIPLVQALFLGVQAAVLVVVLRALWSVAKRALKIWWHWLIAAAAFCALFSLGLPFPVVILAAAAIGAALPQPDDGAATSPAAQDSAPRLWHTIALWSTLWMAPLALLWVTDQRILTELGLFFAQMAVVSFGGAYALLAYMTQAVVETHGWLEPQQMLDALGLAETTPGPLILVTQFVGFLAGFQAGGLGLALAATVLTLWMTFVPCFLWIFAGAPYIEWISAQPRLKGALHAITAAVVGVMANLSLWFALHVYFDQIIDTGFGPLPVITSIDVISLGLSVLAAGLLLGARLGLPLVLALTAGCAAALTLAGV